MFFLWPAPTRNTKVDTTRKRSTMDFAQPGAATVGQPLAENTTFETIELGTDSPSPPALETSEARSFSLSGPATSTQSFPPPPYDGPQPPPRYQRHLGNLGAVVLLPARFRVDRPGGQYTEEVDLGVRPRTIPAEWTMALVVVALLMTGVVLGAIYGATRKKEAL